MSSTAYKEAVAQVVAAARAKAPAIPGRARFVALRHPDGSAYVVTRLPPVVRLLAGAGYLGIARLLPGGATRHEAIIFGIHRGGRVTRRAGKSRFLDRSPVTRASLADVLALADGLAGATPYPPDTDVDPF